MDSYKSYRTLATAKKAVKAAGLHGMIVRYDDVTGSYRGAKNIQPVVLCDLREDKREVEERGFRADMKRKTLEIGATVRLVGGGDLAVVRSFTVDGVVLDRPLGGTRFWVTGDVKLIAPEPEDVA